MNPGADKLNALCLSVFIVTVKILPVCSHVHEKDGAIQGNLAVFPGNDRLLHRVHAAYGRTIPIVAKVHISRSHTLKPGDFPRFLFVGRPSKMPPEGSRCGEDPFKFQGSHHIGKGCIGVGIVESGIKGFEPGRHDEGAHIQGDFRLLFIKINGSRRTEFFTCPALSLLKEDAIVLVDDVFEGDGLGVGHINGFPFHQAFIVDVIHFLGAFFRAGSAGDTFIHVHISRMADNGHTEVPLVSGDVLDFTERQ